MWRENCFLGIPHKIRQLWPEVTMNHHLGPSRTIGGVRQVLCDLSCGTDWCLGHSVIWELKKLAFRQRAGIVLQYLNNDDRAFVSEKWEGNLFDHAQCVAIYLITIKTKIQSQSTALSNFNRPFSKIFSVHEHVNSVQDHQAEPKSPHSTCPATGPQTPAKLGCLLAPNITSSRPLS